MQEYNHWTDEGKADMQAGNSGSKKYTPQLKKPCRLVVNVGVGKNSANLISKGLKLNV